MVAGTGLWVTSDIYALDHVVRHTGIAHGKILLIDVLREIFARDHEYHYVADKFGFPKTPNHLNLPPDAGIQDELTTRILISGFYRYVQSYLPVVSVRQTGSTYKPISFNQNRLTYDYILRRTEDGYGNVDFIRTPNNFTLAGAWEQTYEIKVTSNSQEDTAAIADIVMVSLQGKFRDPLERNGLFIKQISHAGENAESINANDPVWTVSITANTYSEWRREIPIANLLERIRLLFTVEINDSADIPANAEAFRVDIT